MNLSSRSNIILCTSSSSCKAHKHEINMECIECCKVFSIFNVNWPSLGGCSFSKDQPLVPKLTTFIFKDVSNNIIVSSSLLSLFHTRNMRNITTPTPTTLTIHQLNHTLGTLSKLAPHGHHRRSRTYFVITLLCRIYIATCGKSRKSIRTGSCTIVTAGMMRGFGVRSIGGA